MNVSGCLSGNLPVRLSAAANGALTSGTNAWTNNESFGFFRPLGGTVDLTTGDAEFHMWADGSHDAAMIFSGTLDADGSLQGTVTDPMPGFSPIFHFSGDPICTGQATGQRR